MKFFKVTAEPTVLHCLDCTLYRYSHYYMLLFMLTPLGFHSNILLRFNCARKKGKPLKQFFVWEVPFSQLWKVLPEYSEQFSMRGVPIRLECTARTYWICLYRIYLELALNLNNTIFFPRSVVFRFILIKERKIKIAIFKILKIISFAESKKNTNVT